MIISILDLTFKEAFLKQRRSKIWAKLEVVNGHILICYKVTHFHSKYIIFLVPLMTRVVMLLKADLCCDNI